MAPISFSKRKMTPLSHPERGASSYSPLRFIPSIFHKHRPLHLTLFVTRKCNARCSFCFYLADENVAQNQDEDLSLAEYEKLSTSLGKLLWLAFSGGEIFMREDLVELSKIFYERNQPSFILLPTNGMQTQHIIKTTREIAKACPRSKVVVKISLDGPRELHDTIRGVSGCYDKAMQTFTALERLQKTMPNLELGINTVFCSLNQDIMDQWLRQVQTIAPDHTHTISLIRGASHDPQLKEIDQKLYQETIEALARQLKQKKSGQYSFPGAKVKAAQDIVQRDSIYKTLDKEKRTRPCYAGKLSLVVDRQGDCYPCEDFSMKIGNLRDYEFDAMATLQSEGSRQVLQKIDQNKCCCTHECATMLNILFNPARYPAVLKEYCQL